MIGYNKSEIVGKMRERVILQNRIITQSDSGFQSEIYNDIGIYWSKIEYKTGFEEEDADKITNQQKINITLRYNILVNVNSRFVYRNELYQVEKVEYSDDRRFMTCVCVWRSSYTSIYAGSIFCSASLLAQSSLSAALMRVIKYQASLNAFGSVTADINFVQKAQASLTGAGTTTANLTVASSATLLLDLYPNAAAAYSLRKLRTAYTGSAIRVRRSSDNTEQDIGFVADQLDTVSLLSFCGAGNGFVTTWYDQSGNARNATQTVQANQPQIVSSGVVINETFIGASKPTLRFTTQNTLNFSNNIANNVGNVFIKTVASITGGDAYRSLVEITITTFNASRASIYGRSTTNLEAGGRRLDSDSYQFVNSSIVATKGLFGALFDYINAQLYVYVNNNSNQRSGGFQTAGNTSNTDSSKNSIGNNSASLTFQGNISETIIYTTNQAANNTGINNNINTHYAIY